MRQEKNADREVLQHGEPVGGEIVNMLASLASSTATSASKAVARLDGNAASCCGSSPPVVGPSLSSSIVMATADNDATGYDCQSIKTKSRFSELWCRIMCGCCSDICQMPAAFSPIRQSTEHRETVEFC